MPVSPANFPPSHPTTHSPPVRKLQPTDDYVYSNIKSKGWFYVRITKSGCFDCCKRHLSAAADGSAGSGRAAVGDGRRTPVARDDSSHTPAGHLIPHLRHRWRGFAVSTVESEP